MSNPNRTQAAGANTVASIRPFLPDDAAELARAIHESVAELSPWLPWCSDDYGIEDARDWIKRSRAGHAAGTLFNFAILHQGKLAGSCGLNRIDSLYGVANLGYWVRSGMAGRGLAAVAAAQVVRWALEHTTLRRIEIVSAVDNPASQRVAESIGARREGILRQRTTHHGRPVDAFLYAIIRDNLRAGSDQRSSRVH